MAAEEDGGTESVDLKDLCKEMFDKITQYLNGELTGEFLYNSLDAKRSAAFNTRNT